MLDREFPAAFRGEWEDSTGKLDSKQFAGSESPNTVQKAVPVWALPG
jgi:hypothetical protein